MSTSRITPATAARIRADLKAAHGSLMDEAIAALGRAVEGLLAALETSEDITVAPIAPVKQVSPPHAAKKK